MKDVPTGRAVEIDRRPGAPQRTALRRMAAAVGLLLGAIGVNGVISWASRQRTAELGIRAAFGARAFDLMRMILGRAGFVAVEALRTR